MKKQNPKSSKKQIPKRSNVKIEIDPAPKGEWKVLGGSNRDQWNERLSNLVIRALPIDQQNTDTVSKAGSAAISGVVDMNPANPIEGVLISQIVVANEAALKFYQLAWLNNAEYVMQKRSIWRSGQPTFPHALPNAGY